MKPIYLTIFIALLALISPALAFDLSTLGDGEVGVSDASLPEGGPARVELRIDPLDGKNYIAALIMLNIPDELEVEDTSLLTIDGEGEARYGGFKEGLGSKVHSFIVTGSPGLTFEISAPGAREGDTFTITAGTLNMVKYEEGGDPPTIHPGTITITAAEMSTIAPEPTTTPIPETTKETATPAEIEKTITVEPTRSPEAPEPTKVPATSEPTKVPATPEPTKTPGFEALLAVLGIMMLWGLKRKVL